MKKVTIALVALFAITTNTSAQIPNNGFENWNTIDNCLKPEGWYSTNDFLETTGSYFAVTRSNDHYPSSIGSYSIRIENNTLLVPNWGSMGFAWTGNIEGSDNPAFPVSGHPTSFCGYYKFLPQNRDTMRIFIMLYDNGNEIAQVGYRDTVTVPNWTPFVLPIPDYLSVDSARIFLSSFNSDGAMLIQGNSVLYIDNLSFNNLITQAPSQLAQNKMFCLYPNPASTFVSLSIECSEIGVFKLNVYNVVGKLVKMEVFNQKQIQINVSDLENGIYIVEIKCNEKSEKQKLIVHK